MFTKKPRAGKGEATMMSEGEPHHGGGKESVQVNTVGAAQLSHRGVGTICSELTLLRLRGEQEPVGDGA